MYTYFCTFRSFRTLPTNIKQSIHFYCKVQERIFMKYLNDLYEISYYSVTIIPSYSSFIV